jgi:hypothetical protein
MRRPRRSKNWGSRLGREPRKACCNGKAKISGHLKFAKRLKLNILVEVTVLALGPKPSTRSKRERPSRSRQAFF